MSTKRRHNIPSSELTMNEKYQTNQFTSVLITSKNYMQTMKTMIKHERSRTVTNLLNIDTNKQKKITKFKANPDIGSFASAMKLHKRASSNPNLTNRPVNLNQKGSTLPIKSSPRKKIKMFQRMLNLKKLRSKSVDKVIKFVGNNCCNKVQNSLAPKTSKLLKRLAQHDLPVPQGVFDNDDDIKLFENIFMDIHILNERNTRKKILELFENKELFKKKSKNKPILNYNLLQKQKLKEEIKEDFKTELLALRQHEHDCKIRTQILERESKKFLRTNGMQNPLRGVVTTFKSPDDLVKKHTVDTIYQQIAKKTVKKKKRKNIIFKLKGDKFINKTDKSLQGHSQARMLLEGQNSISNEYREISEILTNMRAKMQCKEDSLGSKMLTRKFKIVSRFIKVGAIDALSAQIKNDQNCLKLRDSVITFVKLVPQNSSSYCCNLQ